jgi:hypothetical protein
MSRIGFKDALDQPQRMIEATTTAFSVKDGADVLLTELMAHTASHASGGGDAIPAASIVSAQLKRFAEGGVGTGSQVEHLHGLGGTPSIVICCLNTSADADAYLSAAADATKIYVTATNTKYYSVHAIL